MDGTHITLSNMLEDYHKLVVTKKISTRKAMHGHDTW